MTPLRRRMIEDMQVRNLSLHTQASYVQQVSLFARTLVSHRNYWVLRRFALTKSAGASMSFMPHEVQRRMSRFGSR
jgi:hypothetical protein